MHWSIGAIVIVVIAFAIGAWYAKSYPGTIPVIT